MVHDSDAMEKISLFFHQLHYELKKFCLQIPKASLEKKNVKDNICLQVKYI
jgi:hypothetical protein